MTCATECPRSYITRRLSVRDGAQRAHTCSPRRAQQNIAPLSPSHSRCPLSPQRALHWARTHICPYVRIDIRTHAHTHLHWAGYELIRVPSLHSTHTPTRLNINFCWGAQPRLSCTFKASRRRAYAWPINHYQVAPHEMWHATGALISHFGREEVLYGFSGNGKQEKE